MAGINEKIKLGLFLILYKNPIQLFGVAYGLDDIGWANKTIDLVRDNIIELEKRDSITVDNFVNYWENKLL